MDPISLSILFGASLISGYALEKSMQQTPNKDIVLRRVFASTDGWLATEIMSPEAARLVGQIMDMDLLLWWPKVHSGCYRIIILVQVGGPIDRHLMLLVESAGTYGWFLAQAHRYGYRRANQADDYQRIDAMLDHMNRDPADEVAKTAAQITDPVWRYRYLREAISVNPRLSALVSRNSDFLRITKATVAQPAVQQLKAQQEQQRLPATEPRAISMDEQIIESPRELVPAHVDHDVWGEMRSRAGR